jgi:catechol 2,3-dioxygenase-like lactoylglutathione lyase family enzyme
MLASCRLGAVRHYVNDVDRTETFYRDVLGLTVQRIMSWRLCFVCTRSIGWRPWSSDPTLSVMRHDDIWDSTAAESYDTPGVGMFAPEVLRPAVQRLAELAGDGAVLEFAIGTGRVAVPLRERGLLHV